MAPTQQPVSVLRLLALLCLRSLTRSSALPVEDATALLQQNLQSHHRQSSQRLAAAVSEGANHAVTQILDQFVFEGDFDCTKTPDMCKAPFNCQSMSAEDAARWKREGLAASGEPNYRSWCGAPHYSEYAVACASGALDKAAWVQYNLTVAGTFGPHVAEMDGSYCFLDGHCANKAVTSDTTLEEAVTMCDERYGRDAWTALGKGSANGIIKPSEMPADPANGFTKPEQTRPFVLAACAMGNFHCDVRYCQLTYCKNEYYVKKYGHLLKDFGWE